MTATTGKTTGKTGNTGSAGTTSASAAGQALPGPDAERPRVGWIGTGVMGAAMSRRLLEAGFEVTVHTRTRERAEPVLAAGAAWADTAAEAVDGAGICFTIVGYPSDVRQVYLAEGGLVEAAAPGTVLVDCTTSSPSLAAEIADAAAGRGVAVLDAPVSGGDVGARNGTLSIMVGGDADAVDRARPCLEVLGQTIVHQGPPGSGQHTKMVNQTLIASNMVGVCEALLYAHRAGLDLDTVLESVGGGAAASWTLANLAPRIIAGDFEPGFYVEHFIKDMGLALDEARRMGLAVPGLALANQLYVALAGQGHGRSGTQALHLALASMSGVDWEAPGPR